MRKFVIVVIVLVVGVKYGVGFIFSEDFQIYANKSKEPWTCVLENVIGQMCIVMSRYDDAQVYFSHTVARCPESSMGEDAEFAIAQSLEKKGYVRQATQAYDAFAAKHPRSRHTRMAIRASQMLGNS